MDQGVAIRCLILLLLVQQTSSGAWYYFESDSNEYYYDDDVVDFELDEIIKNLMKRIRLMIVITVVM